MDPDTKNCVILRTFVVKKSFLAMPSSGEQVEVQGMGVKKNSVNAS